MDFNQNLIEKLIEYFSPEQLELSPFLNHMDPDLFFKTSSLLEITEISSLINKSNVSIEDKTKELENVLKNLSIVNTTSNINGNGFTYVMQTSFHCFVLLNLPTSYKKEDIIKLFDIKAEKTQRIYKNQMYWMITSTNEDFNKWFTNVLKEKITIENDIVLKYEINNNSKIIKSMKKKIQNLEYNKEIGGLKNSGLGNKDNGNGNGLGVSVTKESRGMSWRKQSDASESTNNMGLGRDKNESNDLGNNNSNSNKGGFARSRYNSDVNSYNNFNNKLSNNNNNNNSKSTFYQSGNNNGNSNGNNNNSNTTVNNNLGDLNKISFINSGISYDNILNNNKINNNNNIGKKEITQDMVNYPLESK